MGDAEIREAFKAMGPLLMPDKYLRDTKEEKDPKKHKREHPQENQIGNTDVAKLVRLMGNILLRLDNDNQLMRKQDSFVFFLQTAAPALLPHLMTKAKEWHNQMKQRTQAAEESTPYTPLRLVLFQDLAHMMEGSVIKLSKAGSEDELWKTALNHGVITAEGSFPFQPWSQLQKTLVPVKKEHITMNRMLKYMEQLKQISTDLTAIQKIHALKPAENRHDELQSLLEQLQGSTVWGLIGATMKPHTQVQSKQYQELQQFLGKGKGKQKGHPSKAKGQGKYTRPH